MAGKGLGISEEERFTERYLARLYCLVVRSYYTLKYSLRYFQFGTCLLIACVDTVVRIFLAPSSLEATAENCPPTVICKPYGVVALESF